jgi:hypothetical protein
MTHNRNRKGTGRHIVSALVRLPAFQQIPLSGVRMARKTDKKGRSGGKYSSFIALERYIKASPAWQSLSLAARCGYLELLDIYNGSNNGTLPSLPVCSRTDSAFHGPPPQGH